MEVCGDCVEVLEMVWKWLVIVKKFLQIVWNCVEILWKGMAIG